MSSLDVMGYSDEQLNWIFDRTDGHCHICGKRLCFGNYNRSGTRGCWEVEHHVPRAAGGSNARRNLFPACVQCNRRKGAGTTRQARARHGRRAAPLSAARKSRVRDENTAIGAVLGGVGAMVAGGGPVGLAIVSGIGALLGRSIEPDKQKGKRRRR